MDTDAKIENLTGFRDNQLDSETAQRKLLANETGKIAVEISFRIERDTDGPGGLKIIADALRESGYLVLADSTASLITLVVAVSP